MQRLFPRALVACIRDGRTPEAHELARVSERLRAEAVCFWGPDPGNLAEKFASVALSGCPAEILPTLAGSSQKAR